MIIFGNLNLSFSVSRSLHAVSSFLGFVDLYGSNYKEDVIATGYGAHLAIPILRKRWRADLTFEEAKKLLDECVTVCYYRDCRAINRVRNRLLCLWPLLGGGGGNKKRWR